MSQIKVQKPKVIHLPSFQEYQTPASVIREKIKALGLEIPMGMLDFWYYYTDLAGWGEILFNLVFKSDLYKRDRFDCEDFALKAMVTCRERYGLNTMAMVIGDMPLGRHGFNMFYTGAEFWLWEPNEGFAYSGEPFAIGENDYFPEIILI